MSIFNVKVDKFTKGLCCFTMALLIFSNQFLGCSNAYVKKYVVTILVLGAICCFSLLLEDMKKAKQILFSPLSAWIVAFAIFMCVDGMLTPNGFYSREFHLLSLCHVVMLLFIAYYYKDDLLEMLSYAACMVIPAMTIGIFKYDARAIYEHNYWGETYRIGTTPNGGVIEASITFMLLMIPLVYQIIYRRKWIYLIFVANGIVMMGLAGSKVCIVTFAAAIVGMAVMAGKNKKQRMTYIAILVGIAVVLILVCYIVPVLRINVFDRFVSMFSAMSGEGDMTDSTNRRSHFAYLAFINAWDKPLLGHGFYQFMYQVNGFDEIELIYPNSHCNYTEILYSFGVVGLLAYYWFPIKTAIDSFRAKRSNKQIMALCFCLVILLIEVASITFYRNIVSYVYIGFAYILLTEYGTKKED